MCNDFVNIRGIVEEIRAVLPEGKELRVMEIFWKIDTFVCRSCEFCAGLKNSCIVIFTLTELRRVAFALTNETNILKIQTMKIYIGKIKETIFMIFVSVGELLVFVN